MHIIEQSIIGKRSQELCEDAVVVTDHFVAVIDGSTSKTGGNGGVLAARLVSEVIRTMPAETDMQQFIRLANERFQTCYRECYNEEELLRMQTHPEYRWTCSVVVYSYHEHALWMIGDCQAMVGDTLYTNDKPYESVLASQRAEYARQLLASGRETIDSLRRHDTARDRIIPAMLEEMKNQNVTYSVLDGFPVAMHNVRRISLGDNTTPLPLGEGMGEWLILASDGYPRLFPTLAETEQYLRQVLTADPLMITLHPATKAWMEGNNSFDDRTYVRFSV